MEDGGYGISISDSMTLDDLLRDVDVSKLKFDDKTFTSYQIDFGDIDIAILLFLISLKLRKLT